MGCNGLEFELILPSDNSGRLQNEIRKFKVKQSTTLHELQSLNLMKMWRSHNIRVHTKFRVYKASIVLYSCEAWDLTAETDHRVKV